MGKIYNGGNNYGESLDELETLWLSSDSGYYEQDGILLDATHGYCYISLREDEYDGNDTYTQYYTQIDSDQISVERICSESGETNTYETQIKPENIVTNDIVRYGGYWGSEDSSHSLENTLEYLYGQMGDLEEHSLPSVSPAQQGRVPMVNGYGRWVVEALPSDAKDFDNDYIHSSQDDIVMNDGYWGGTSSITRRKSESSTWQYC